MNALDAKTALDASYLEARARILDLAAILDRIDRGGGLENDARMELLHRGIDVLLEEGPGRAERIQQIFSLQYDAGWERPKPRM